MAAAARSARAQPVKATCTQRSLCPRRSSSRNNATNNIQRAYSKVVTQRTHMPVGSPTVEVIKPNHPEFPLYKNNLERRLERMQVFIKPSDSEDSVQLESLLKNSEKIQENLPLYRRPKV